MSMSKEVLIIDGEVSLGLCEGRHSIPDVEGYIFGNEISDPTDLDAMFLQAYRTLVKLHPEHLNLYVTGLTVALIETIKAANSLGVTVALWHFNRATGDYYRQTTTVPGR